MKRSMSQIIRAALAADESVRPDQRDAVMAILTEKRPANDRSVPQALLVTQAEAGRLLNVSRFTIRRLVEDGGLHPVNLRGVRRCNRKEIEKVASGGTE